METLISSPKRFQKSLHPYVKIQVFSKDKVTVLAFPAAGSTASTTPQLAPFGSDVKKQGHTHKAQTIRPTDKGDTPPLPHQFMIFLNKVSILTELIS